MATCFSVDMITYSYPKVNDWFANLDNLTRIPGARFTNMDKF